MNYNVDAARNTDNWIVENSDQYSPLVNFSNERYCTRVKCLFKKEQENGHVIGTAKCVILKEN